MLPSWQGLLDRIEESVILTHKTLESSGKTPVLFCAGPFAQKAFALLKKNNINIPFFIDNNKNLEGSCLCGVTVKYQPWVYNETFREKYIAIIASSHVNCLEIAAQLDGEDIQHIPFNAFGACLFFKKYKEVVFYLHDDVSKYSYLAAVYCLLTGDVSYIQNIEEQYFGIREFKSASREIVVDAGAYVGDSLEQYICHSNGLIGKIYLFEPFDRPFEALQIRAKRLSREWALNDSKMVFEKAGLGRNTDNINFSDDGEGLLTPNPEGTIRLRVYSIDDYFVNKPFTILKADIEGGEIDLLYGGKESIIKYAPKITISIYHSPEDFFSIIEFLHDLVPDYHFAVRNSQLGFEDTILYCWK